MYMYPCIYICIDMNVYLKNEQVHKEIYVLLEIVYLVFYAAFPAYVFLRSTFNVFQVRYSVYIEVTVLTG